MFNNNVWIGKSSKTLILLVYKIEWFISKKIKKANKSKPLSAKKKKVNLKVLILNVL